VNNDAAVPASITQQAAGRCALAGDLTLATAGELWKLLRSSGLLHSADSVDASGVADSDSAGLALLIAWRAARIKAGGDLAITSLPARLSALARITEAEGIVHA